MDYIDVTKVVIPYNYVLIKLDPDFDTYHNTETGDNTGIHVAPWGINQATHLSVTGVVMQVPNALIYNGYEMAVLKKDQYRTASEQQHIADLRKESMAYDVPMELSKGLRVYFEYTTRLNAFKEGRALEQEDGKYIWIPYDMLVMAFKPSTDMTNVKISDVYMLNGFLLIKILEYATEKGSDGIKGVKTISDVFIPVQEDAKYVHQENVWYANVLSAGCGVKSYADFPGRGGEYEVKNTPGGRSGDKIIFDGRHKKRLEQPAHRVIFKKHELYRIHRKDIFGWFPDGNVNGMPKV